VPKLQGSALYGGKIMYHVGRIIEIMHHEDKEIISSNKSVQAVVEMWDENVMTVGVDEALYQKIRNKDVVVVDYTPVSEKIVLPKQTIIKIIKGKKADTVWKAYKDFFHKGKTVASKPDQKYFG
jgi:hypothetical protein